MTPIRNLLSDAVRYGLAAGAVGFAGLASMSALAQNAPAPSSSDSSKAKEVGRIEVIGSRIKRAVDTEPTAPVTTMTRADIQQTGLTSTFDVINHISASDGSGLSTVTTQTNGSDGSTSVSLREMGASRTLVLVDGKRWPADANGIVDLSSIPVAIIERIDPKVVSLEMDVYWTTAGGMDPAAMLDAYPGRYKLIHLKDMKQKMRFEGDGGTAAQWVKLFPYMTDAGQGVLDVANIVAHARKAGVEHFIVEHDQAEDPIGSLRANQKFLSAL